MAKEQAKRAKMDNERRHMGDYTYLRRKEMNMTKGMEKGRRGKYITKWQGLE